MRILGFDQSVTQTGWCLYEAPGDERRMLCGSFSCKDEADAEAQCDLFGHNLKRLIGRYRPEFIAWERASRRISSYVKKGGPDFFAASAAPRMTVNADQLLLPEIQGMIRAAAILYRLPFESVPVSTWRADIFGVGGGSMTKKVAKARAKEYCRQLGIEAGNENEAEAACVARWAATCSQRFRLLRVKREAA